MSKESLNSLKKRLEGFNIDTIDAFAFIDDDIEEVKNIIDMPVTIIELSDEMKTGVQSSSQPLFELLGGVSLSYWGAQAVSDSMENNIIPSNRRCNKR